MAPARRGRSRTGARETTPTTSHARGNQASDPRIYPNPRERPFPAPHHRPPLAGLQLVRPRPRLPARRCGRSSLTPARATAQNRSDEEKPHHTPAPPGDAGKVTGRIRHALLTAGVPMGADISGVDPGRWAVPRGSGRPLLVFHVPGSCRLFPVASGPRAESVLIPGGLWSKPIPDWFRPVAPWVRERAEFMLEGRT